MIYVGIGGIGSSSSSVPQLEDDGIDVHMYIKPGNPHFIAKLNRRRPKGLVCFFIHYSN